MLRVLPISRLSSRSRSLSDRPPQIPYGSPTSRACARHCAITGQRRHISLARRSRCSRARPRSPSGWKNTDESTPRQRPRNCHSQMSALGPGSCSGCGIEVPLYTPMFQASLRTGKSSTESSASSVTTRRLKGRGATEISSTRCLGRILNCGLGIYPEFIDAVSSLGQGVHGNPRVWGNVPARDRIRHRAQ